MATFRTALWCLFVALAARSSLSQGPPPGTMPPGTTPPGTAPPGTVPPGTAPPGTLSPDVTQAPGTVPPGTMPPLNSSATPSPSPTSSPSSSPSSSSSCFSASETLLHKNGSYIPMHQAQIGDEVLTHTGHQLEFSPIVFLPHGFNTMKHEYVKLETASTSVMASVSHLIMTADCATDSDLKLVRASEVGVGMCVLTRTGAQAVVSVSEGMSYGAYTAVPLNGGYIVVNGVVASPFVLSHHVVNAWYTMHRALYRLSPDLVKGAATWIQMVQDQMIPLVELGAKML